MQRRDRRLDPSRRDTQCNTARKALCLTWRRDHRRRATLQRRVTDPEESQSACSWLLHRTQILHQTIDHRVNVCALRRIATRRGVIELPAPDGHIASTMRSVIPAAIDGSTNVFGWKFAAIAMSDQGQVGNASFDQRCNRPLSTCIQTMATRAEFLIELDSTQ